MPRDPVTGVFTLVSNSFSDPIVDTIIDPTDADATWDDLTDGLNSVPHLGDATADSIKFNGSSSGDTTLEASAVASGTLTLPAATDTLVGKATTDTLTNKTFDTAGTGNSFSINGVAVTANTGTGAVVRATSPVLVTPNLGTPSAVVLTNGTGLPLSTGITGTGTGVLAALAVNVGSLGAVVVNGGALGTPSSATLTNATGLPLTTGVTGNLPVTNLNSGTSASGTTFWCGDGTWKTPGGAGTVTSVTGNGVTITGAGTIPPPLGLVNHSLAVSAAGSALTIALKDAAGSDPSASSPVNGHFRNASATSSGTWAQLTVTSALSLTVSSGSTLGVTSSTAFRLWVVLFNDGGTARLGVINCAVPTATISLNEGTLASSTAEGGAGGADNAGVFYTGTAVTSKAFLIVGYAEWSSSGLTAGTWTTTNLLYVQSFGPGIRKPGDPVGNSQTVLNGGGSTTSNTTATDVTGASVSISPTSAANAIRVVATAAARVTAGGAGTNSTYTGNLVRTSTTLTSGTVSVSSASGTNVQTDGFVALSYLDSPNTTSSTTYKLQHFTTGGTSSVTTGNVNLHVEEIMR